MVEGEEARCCWRELFIIISRGRRPALRASCRRATRSRKLEKPVYPNHELELHYINHLGAKPTFNTKKGRCPLLAKNVQVLPS